MGDGKKDNADNTACQRDPDKAQMLQPIEIP